MREPFVRLLGPHNIVGIYGVFVFFIVSGFLVTQSLLVSPSTLSYFWRRLLRIYPGLVICLSLSAFVVGPFFSQKGFVGFLTSSESITYLLGNLWRPGRPPDMPSVVLYVEPSGWLGTMINGSLWTIFHEVACYVLLGLINLVRALKFWTMTLLCLGMALITATGLTPNSATIADFLFVAPAFFAGVALSLIEFQRTQRMLRLATVLAAIVVLGLAYRYSALLLTFQLAGAPIILLIGTSRRLRLPTLRGVGDMSYGTYLYGWPVEQLVRVVVGPDAGWSLIFMLSLPMAFALGYLSWWTVERPSLQFKTVLDHFPKYKQ